MTGSEEVHLLESWHIHNCEDHGIWGHYEAGCRYDFVWPCPSDDDGPVDWRVDEGDRLHQELVERGIIEC